MLSEHPYFYFVVFHINIVYISYEIDYIWLFFSRVLKKIEFRIDYPFVMVILVH